MEKTSYTVIIEKRHCEMSSGYVSSTNCPLCVAIREQLPDFKLKNVSGTYVTDMNENRYHFDAVIKKWEDRCMVWNYTTMEMLKLGEINSYTLIFSKEIKQPLPPSLPEDTIVGENKKEVRYVVVSIPETISKQTKDLILS